MDNRKLTRRLKSTEVVLLYDKYKHGVDYHWFVWGREKGTLGDAVEGWLAVAIENNMLEVEDMETFEGLLRG